FVRLLTDEYGDGGKALAGAPGAAQSYDAVVAGALAMVAGGEATGTAIDENLHRVANAPGKKVTSFAEGKRELEAGNEIDYVGASGPLEFNDSNTAAPDYGVFQVKDGTFVPIARYTAAQLLGETGKDQQ